MYVKTAEGMMFPSTPGFSIIYDAEFEQLSTAGIQRVQMKIFEKVWEEVEDFPVWPHIHMIAKSDVGERDPATV